ncbi:MAG: PAS domain-containing sensor histidine kinase [Candidatus Paceibacterota bacterium]
MKRGLSKQPKKHHAPFISDAPSFYLYAHSDPNPTLISNNKDEIQYVNPAWERLTGYSSEEVHGKSPRILHSGKTPSHVYEALHAALSKGAAFESEEIIDRKKDGTEFSIRSVFFPIKSHGKVKYFAQVMHDISERKIIEKQKDMFISAAAHELRSPLSVIMTSVELLKLELGAVPDAAAEILKTLRDETGRFASLLSDLLDVSRMQTGRVHMKKEEHDLRQLVHRVIDELRPSYTSHSIIVEGSGGDALRIAYDEPRIEEVIGNLVSNAVKYSPQADRVVVRIDTDADSAIVCVQDFGVGIDEAEQQKVFEMFYRASNRGRIRGTGLGLFLSSQIVAAHGGRLWVKSVLGTGSIFHFSLPLKSTADE